MNDIVLNEIDYTRQALSQSITIEHADELLAKIHHTLVKHFPNSLQIKLAGFSCRVPTFSKAYLKICFLLDILNRIERNEKITKIIIQSPDIYKTLFPLLNKNSKNIKIELQKNNRHNLKLLISPFFLYFNSIYFLLKRFTLGKLFKFQVTNKNDIILIDDFIKPNSIQSGNYMPSNYSGLHENIAQGKIRNIFFLPYLFYTKKMRITFSALKKSPYNFILKENFLKPIDYLQIITSWLRMVTCKMPHLEERGIIFSHLIKKDLIEYYLSGIGMESILTYQFLKRFKEHGCQIQLAIDWYENQPSDRAFIIGIREHYPKTYIKGYQGYVLCPADTHLYSKEYELRNGWLPDELLMIGEGFLQPASSGNPKMKYNIAPGFKYQNVWTFQISAVKKIKRKILIALSMDWDECIYILNLTTKIIFEDAGVDEVFIKLHPTYTKEHIKRLNNNGRFKKLKITEKNVYDLFTNIDLIISGNTSVALEAAACAIPVIIVSNLQPFQPSISKECFTICHSTEAVINSIITFTQRLSEDRDFFLQNALNIRKHFFAPVNSSTVNHFLSTNEFGVADA